MRRHFQAKAFKSQCMIHHAVFPGTENPEASFSWRYQRKEVSQRSATT